MRAPKLSIPQQINDMKNKGITFDICNESEAKEFLTNHNYYYKLKAYSHNYDTYKSGPNADKYINLDFAYLKDLSTIDAELRKNILSMTVDLEHFLKVKLNNDLTMVDEDGYEIVQVLLNAHPDYSEKLEEKVNTSTCHNIIEKHKDNWAVWNIVELMSFGQLIELYSLFYHRNWGSFDKITQNDLALLYPVKMLRNAAAHNNCLINQMRAPYARNIVPSYDLRNRINEIMPKQKNKDVIIRKLQHPAIHDFCALVLLYYDVVPEPTKSKGLSKLSKFINGRMVSNREFYAKQEPLKAYYKFISEFVGCIFPMSRDEC